MQPKTPEQIAAKRAIEVLGGPVQAAITLRVPGNRYQTVQSWARHRVPAEYCPLVERETTALGDPVRCEELRSDVQWGVLRMKLTPKRRATDKRTSKTNQTGA
jgi:DNA-binding transcriptional regulator YdaS (Cro superfamily)